MLGKLGAALRSVLAGANVIVIALMSLSGMAGHISPESSPVLASAGYALPMFIILNALFILAWVAARPKMALLPIAGFIVCYCPVRAYCPLNIKRDIPADALKVITFNVQSLDKSKYPPDGGGAHPALEYLKAQDADIVCLQECPLNDATHRLMEGVYPYIDTVKHDKNGSTLAVMSKFPVVKKERIAYPSAGNLSAAFFIKMGHDTLLVINNHLETSGLTLGERDEFNNMVHNAYNGFDNGGILLSDTTKKSSRKLLAKLGESAKRRAPQARAVAEYVRKNKGKSVILCGDFNDTPISYAHRTIAKGLTDCYVESGNGPGWSYNHGFMRVRIDNIMCSSHWKPCSCKVDTSIEASDHFPVVCLLCARPAP